MGEASECLAISDFDAPFNVTVYGLITDPLVSIYDLRHDNFEMALMYALFWFPSLIQPRHYERYQRYTCQELTMHRWLLHIFRFAEHCLGSQLKKRFYEHTYICMARPSIKCYAMLHCDMSSDLYLHLPRRYLILRMTSVIRSSDKEREITVS